MIKKALITGIDGQDGSYLAEFLLDKQYEVHGTIKNFQYKNINSIHDKLKLYQLDVSSMNKDIQKFLIDEEFDEVYNMVGQSHLYTSFDFPEKTIMENGIYVMNILSTIRENKLKTKFFQASSSEMFGVDTEMPQTEKTPLTPKSPYAIAKSFAHSLVQNYREVYGIFACNGILYNHESPRRKNIFVSKKIVCDVQDVIDNKISHLEIGNLDSKRDWSHAKDFVEGMWLSLQHSFADDYIFSSGVQHTVRDFVEKVFSYHGVKILWLKNDLEEIGINLTNDKIVVKVVSKYSRSNDFNFRVGNPKKIKNNLLWIPKYNFSDLIFEMCEVERKTRK